MSKNVAVPGVGVISFPDDMSDDDISAVIRSQHGPELRSPTMHELSTAPLKVLLGAGKSVAKSVIGAGELAHKAGEKIGLASPTPAFDEARAAVAPSDIWEKLGSLGGDIGQFAIPGEAEAGMLAPAAKVLGKLGIAGRVLRGAAEGAGGTAVMTGGDKTQTALGAALGGGGAAVGGLVGKLAMPFAKSLDQPAIQAAERLGVELPASAKSTAPAVTLLETLGAKGLFSSKIVQRVRDANQALVDAGQSLAESAGTADAAGPGLSRTVTRYKSAFQDTKNALYDAAEIPKEGLPVTPQNTLGFLDKIIEEKKAAGAGDTGFFTALRKRIGPVQPKGTVNIQGEGVSPDLLERWKQLNPDMAAATEPKPQEAWNIRAILKDLNSRIKNPNDPIATGNKAVLMKVRSMLSQDFEGAMAEHDPELASRLQDAKDFYEKGLQKVNQAWGKKVVQLKDQPDKIVSAVFGPKMSSEDIPRILDVAGPEVSDHIRAAVLGDILSKARNPEGTGLAPLSLNMQIQKWGPDKLQSLLKPQQWSELQDLAKVSAAMGRGQKVETGSQTTFLGRLAGEIGSFMIHPIASLKMLAGDAEVSHLLASRAGQRWLTTGFGSDAVKKLIQITAPAAATSELSPVGPTPATPSAP